VTLSAGVRRQIDLLLASQPETAPWLGVLSAVLEEAAEPTWDAIAVTTTLDDASREVEQARSREVVSSSSTSRHHDFSTRSPGTPLLTGARIPVNEQLADRWVRLLLALAAEAGPEAIALRAAASDGALDSRAVLEAAVNADGERLEAVARSLDIDPDALAAAAALAVMPLLHALRRRFGPGEVTTPTTRCPNGWSTAATIW